MTGDDEEFDLTAACQLLWRYRILVAVVSLLGALLAGLIVFTAKPYFRAEVVVTDARDRGMGGMSALANQLGGLASFAGVNLATGSAANQENSAVLESRHLAEEFITRNGLLPELQRDSPRVTSLWRAVEQFKKSGVVTIRKDIRKGVTTVSVEWTDPATAARWANGYVALANQLIRARAAEDATRNIAYLNDQIQKTNDVELHKVMYNLIENETKTLMIANGRAEYAFEVVDPAAAPELKAGPHRLIMTVVGLVVGFGVGAVIAFVFDRLPWRRARRGNIELGAT